jgi:hypothetical protein
MDDFIYGRHRGRETKEHAAVLYLVVTVTAKQEWRAFIRHSRRQFITNRTARTQDNKNVGRKPVTH